MTEAECKLDFKFTPFSALVRVWAKTDCVITAPPCTHNRHPIACKYHNILDNVVMAINCNIMANRNAMFNSLVPWIFSKFLRISFWLQCHDWNQQHFIFNSIFNKNASVWFTTQRFIRTDQSTEVDRSQFLPDILTFGASFQGSQAGRLLLGV